MADNNTADNDLLNNNTPDYDLNRDADGTEPATKHDVGIGGGLGAVGGAVVGALAGGPVGAVVGAVAGGAASAGAVDVVDKHDHDYARTADGRDAQAPVGTTGYPIDPTAPSAGAIGGVRPGTALEDELDEDDLDSDVSVNRPNTLAR